MSNHYSQQFKDEAVALAIESEGPYRQIAEDLGVNYKTFGNWMRKAVTSKPSGSTKGSVNKQDYQTLERELRAARKELELRKKGILFLKKASAYFAKQSQ